MKLRPFGFASCFCLGLAALHSFGCSGETQENSNVTDTGTVTLPLETFGQSGMRYRLHNATFEVRDKRTARVRAVLNSDDDPSASVLSADLDPGEYQVMLMPGWFIEQLGGGPSFPGPDGTTAPVGPIGTGTPPPPPDGPTGPVFIPAAPPSATTTLGTSPPLFPRTPIGASDTSSDQDEPVGSTNTAVPTPTSTGVGTGGTGPTGSTSGPIEGRIINAVLESNAIEEFTVFPNNSSFVFYTFRVGDNVISFEPGRINVIFEVIEDEVTTPTDPCDDVAAVKRPSVIETATEALQFVTLRDVFDAMAINEGFDTDGETIYKQIIDSYATAAEGRMPDAIHCGDETTDGVPTLNGYPIDCNRQERFQFDNLDAWQATAFVNRFDLAPESGAHCGQQRMIFASNAINRMFFILEAQIPNPRPDSGLAGCQPLAEFWAAQTQISDAETRGARLTAAFLTGAQELQSEGFGPFVRASNYTVGTGQLRTNNFDDGIWTLREFKLATESGDVKAVPFPVAEAPHGALWNDSVSLPNGEFCRDAFLTSLQGLLFDEPNAMTFVVPHECKDAESRNSFEQDYASQMVQGSGSLIAEIEQLVADTGLTAFDIANRASFAGSCIGCHNEAVGRDLGNGITAPFSLDFVHVNEFTETCPDGSSCFQTSDALKSSFLPHRIDVLGRFAEIGMPPFCESEEPTPSIDAGVSTTAPIDNPQTDVTSEIVTTESPVDVNDGVVVDTVTELPEAETPVSELVEQDEEIREQFGRRTIGGQDARVSH